MADFKRSTTAPASKMSTARDPHEQGGLPLSEQTGEAPKLGSESIANFSEGPGVAPSNHKIR